MGIDYSFECTKATVRSKVEGEFDGKTLLLCDLQFEDEHGHALVPLSNVLVAVANGKADLVDYPENVLSESVDEAEWRRIEKLCQNHPGYQVYNGEELAKMLA